MQNSVAVKAIRFWNVFLYFKLQNHQENDCMNEFVHIDFLCDVRSICQARIKHFQSYARHILYRSHLAINKRKPERQNCANSGIHTQREKTPEGENPLFLLSISTLKYRLSNDYGTNFKRRCLCFYSYLSFSDFFFYILKTADSLVPAIDNTMILPAN